MKKILITGTNSYIGTSLNRWLSKYPDIYSVDSISIRNDHWKELNFTGYDVIYHTAAIVHTKEKDTTKYFKVNRDLTVELAEKAKNEGVNQFIFLSTMGVYGTEVGHITADTIPKPKTPYAQSKYEAEQQLEKLNSTDFNIAILRPPLVYGKDCPGNYSRLARLALKLPFFPDINNKRSMIYIDNLSEYTKILIDQNIKGIFFPQNKDYVNTAHLVRLIAKAHGKNIKVVKGLNGVTEIGLMFSETLRKVFGTVIYDIEISRLDANKINKQIEYEVVSFEESIIRTEGRE